MSPAVTTTGAPVSCSGSAICEVKSCESRLAGEQPTVAITRTRVAKATNATLPMARCEPELATGFGERGRASDFSWFPQGRSQGAHNFGVIGYTLIARKNKTRAAFLQETCGVCMAVVYFTVHGA